jgi:hypothetical protein
MDKAQKQLIDTYFRKRDIANEQNGEEDGAFNELAFTFYEFGYILTHNNLDIDIPHGDVKKFFKYGDESKIKKINPNTLSSEILTIALSLSGEFFIKGVTPEKLAELSADQIYKILEHNIYYGKYLDVGKIENSQQIYFLFLMGYMAYLNSAVPEEYPDWLNKFNLDKMDDDDANRLIRRYPELIDKM